MTRATIKPRKTAQGWVLPAPAKLNLYLEIHGRRADGFHELTTLITPLRLCDTLCVSPTNNNGGAITLTVKSALGSGGDASAEHAPVPTDERNLVVKALQKLKSAAGVAGGAAVTLVKRVPSLAGLGGGSSDAAAALRAGEAAWGVSLGERRLQQLAAELGSDVPVLLGGRPAVCRGRGEHTEPMAIPAGLPCVVVQPAAALGAGQVYQALDAPTKSSSRRDRLVELIDALRNGRLAEAGRAMLNDLQPPAERIAPAVTQVKAAMDQLGLLAHQMTGSGAAYFGLCRSLRHAVAVAARLRQQQVGWVAVTSTL